ncbi:MAG TPA: kelch repeat-containing protein [Bacteroidia bacterium]|nr:kelch repeat-containing protein [Bacteroidia bacterium]
MKNLKAVLLMISVTLIFADGVSAQGAWTQKANFGGGNITEERAFSIGNFGYFGGNTAALWQYDPLTDTWTQKASMAGTQRASSAAFSIGTKGYIGTGGGLNDFYEYDQPTNTWTQKANFGGSGREGAVGIAIDGKGYIGTGGTYLSDWWEYDPGSDTWTQKANLAGPGRYHAGAFSLNNKGYICAGFNGTFLNDLWEYDPATNNWISKSPMPGTPRDRPVGIAANGKGYLVTGWTGSTALNDGWEYDPVSDSWSSIAPFAGSPCYNACGFGIGSKIYVGTGYPITNTFYEFGPACVVQATTVPSTCFSSCDGTATVTVPSGTATYLWSSGDTTVTSSGLCSGTYTVTVTDSTGCSNSTTVTVTSPAAISGSATVIPPTCFGDADGSACFLPSGGQPPYVAYQWAIGDTTACISGVPAGLYAVTVTDSAGCTSITNVTITQPSQIVVAISGVNASCSTCTNGSASAAVSGGVPPFTYLWSNGQTIAFINSLSPGVYTCCATDVNGCSSCDSVVITFNSGIGDPAPYLFHVSPNPFNEFINVDVPVGERPVAKLFDCTGRLLFQKQLDYGNSRLSTDGLAPGWYTIELNSSTPEWFRMIKAY